MCFGRRGLKKSCHNRKGKREWPKRVLRWGKPSLATSFERDLGFTTGTVHERGGEKLREYEGNAERALQQGEKSYTQKMPLAGVAKEETYPP